MLLASDDAHKLQDCRPGRGRAVRLRRCNDRIRRARAERGTRIVDSTATNAFDPCELASEPVLKEHDASRLRMHELRQGERTMDDVRQQLIVPVVSSEWLVFNANPVKLGFGCIKRDVQKLAELELSRELISSKCGAPQHMIRHVCAAIQSEGYVTDPLWASIVLIVYLCCESRARCLLAEHTSLTDMDVHIAFVLEAYGRGEITRRARLRMQQQQQQKSERRGGDRRAAPDYKRRRCDGGEFKIEDDTASVVNDADDDHEETIARFCAAEMATLLPTPTYRERASCAWPSDGGASEGPHQEEEDDDEDDEDDDEDDDDGAFGEGVRAAPRIEASTRLQERNNGSRVRPYTVISWVSGFEVRRGVQRRGAALCWKQRSRSGRLRARCSDRCPIRCPGQCSFARRPRETRRAPEQLERFVARCAYQAPRWVALRIPAESNNENGERFAGWPVARSRAQRGQHGVVIDSPTDACSRPPVVLHAHLFASHHLQPPVMTRMAILWSEAAEHLRGTDSRRSQRLGGQSGSLQARRPIQQNPPPRGAGLALDDKVQHDGAGVSTDSGLTRSVVVAATLMAVHTSTFSCADLFAQEGGAVFAQCEAADAASGDAAANRAQPGSRSLAAVEAVGIVPTEPERREPLCTPSSRLAVGLRISEFVRRCMRGRTYQRPGKARSESLERRVSREAAPSSIPNPRCWHSSKHKPAARVLVILPKLWDRRDGTRVT